MDLNFDHQALNWRLGTLNSGHPGFQELGRRSRDIAYLMVENVFCIFGSAVWAYWRCSMVITSISWDIGPCKPRKISVNPWASKRFSSSKRNLGLPSGRLGAWAVAEGPEHDHDERPPRILEGRSEFLAWEFGTQHHPAIPRKMRCAVCVSPMWQRRWSKVIKADLNGRVFTCLPYLCLQLP